MGILDRLCDEVDLKHTIKIAEILELLAFVNKKVYQE